MPAADRRSTTPCTATVYSRLFNFGTDKLSGEDFSVVNTQKWINDIYPQIISYFQEQTQKENIIPNVHNLIFPDTDEKNEVIIEPIKLKIQIDYDVVNDDILAKLFFAGEEAPRFILLFGINQIALIDRNKWNEKRYLQFMM